MLAKNGVSNCGSKKNFFQRAARAISRATCIAVIFAMLPLISGCHPDAIVVGLVGYSLLSVHLDSHKPSASQANPTTTRFVNRSYIRESRPTITRAVASAYVEESVRKVTRAVSQPYRRVNLDSGIDKSSRRNPTVPQSVPPKSTRPSTYTSSLTEAVQAYREIEWDKAAMLLNKAIYSRKLSNSELCSTYILLGAMAYQNGSLSKAERYFARAYRHDKEITLSSETFPPQVVAFYESVNKTR